METAFVQYALSIFPELSEESREILRKALVVKSVGIECPSPGIIRFDEKQATLQPRCWKVLNHVIRFGSTSVDEVERLLSATDDEEVELDNNAVKHIVKTVNASFRTLRFDQSFSASGGCFHFK